MFMRRRSRKLLLGFCMLLLCLSIPAAAPGESVPVADRLSETERLKLGERIYREGILPSGRPMEAFVSGDVPVGGRMFSCLSCHLRSGLGSFEGSIYSPPVNGRRLFMSYNNIAEPVVADDLLMLPFWLRPAVRRVPYTSQSLAEAIRAGVDHSGRELNSAMPRYLLNDEDMEILIHYLRNLSNEISPGVTDTSVRFATVITGEVPSADRDFMLSSLRAVVQAYNTRPALVRRLQLQSAQRRSGGPGAGEGERDRSARNIVLDVWELKGAPETWPQQLEDYYRRKPVFGLIGGLSTRDWRPVHAFCEKNEIPSLLPITDSPVISDTDWYTLYISKGLYQEGEAAARHLARNGDGMNESPLLLLNQAGTALEKGFRSAWEQAGGPAPVTVAVSGAEIAGKSFWPDILKQYRPSVILYWSDSGDPSLLSPLAQAAGSGLQVFLSYGLLRDTLYTIPEEIRPFTYITYPYAADGFSKVPLAKAPWLKSRKIPAGKQELVAKVDLMNTVLTEIFMKFDRYFYRDFLLDTAGMMSDRNVTIPLYPRISFGPGQRYLVKGCSVIQLGTGPSPALKVIHEWMVN